MLAVVRQEEVAEGKGPTEARSTVTQETGGEEKEKEGTHRKTKTIGATQPSPPRKRSCEL